ncbi:ABC transporter permease [Calderihabitans maritimus]|uniref:Binding-protein-dependent transport system inner membrane protein n=1 Tax=Calderihabitans maritimus TaxID=1246530 RepID=A0A1Z5HPP0_9FIRM|nr:ABC transporter permease [Calderihabitans maritimus]GAW91489.1 binding-protein-dependent transport system inner membrane protein [Calderihabitans maritimus]
MTVFQGNKKSRPKLLPYLGAIAIIVFLWQVLSLILHKPVLPPPMTAVKEFIRIFFPVLGRHFVISGYRVVTSLLLALVTAVPIGLVMGAEEKLDRLLSPVVYLVYPIPKIVFLPIVMILLGIGDQAKIFIIVLIIFFQILVTARDAAKGIPRQLVTSVISLGASRKDIYRHVIVPACLPKILTAARVSLGTAIAVLFLTETVAGSTGLGYFIFNAWYKANFSEMFAGIIAMSLLGLICYYVLDLLERFWCRWQYY